MAGGLLRKHAPKRGIVAGVAQPSRESGQGREARQMGQ
jgi:hypothetical protein